MSAFIVILIVAAILFVAFGLQVLSRQVQRFPVDVRRPDPLIDVTSTKAVTVRPAELHQLMGIVSNSLISDAAARSELQPILDGLGADADLRGRSGRGRNRRRQRIDRSISELETLWGIADVDQDEPNR
ncbi:MAG: hypothetical protein ACR2QK_16355 [Acidimicrobiales bacterium]